MPPEVVPVSCMPTLCTAVLLPPAPAVSAGLAVSAIESVLLELRESVMPSEIVFVPVPVHVMLGVSVEPFVIVHPAGPVQE